MERGFNFHDHTADITIECWAPDLIDAFEQAALATFEVILDTSTVEPQDTVEISVTGTDLEELLVEWIGKLIALIDIKGQFYSKFHVDHLEATLEGYMLEARVLGENIDHEKHDTRTEVKAMTYADMRILQEPNQTILWFTLDL
ncbi:MAG: archease [Candidatus Thorarchaeota archaeon]